MMDYTNKKLYEFKSSIISELVENMKVLIQSEFQNTIQKYKNQLEEGEFNSITWHVWNRETQNFKKELG